MQGSFAVIGLGLCLHCCAAALTVSIPNFRDVGGKRTTDGRIIKPGVLYRSASPPMPPRWTVRRSLALV